MENNRSDLYLPCKELRARVRIGPWPKDLEIAGWSESLCSRTQETKRHVLFVTEMTVRLARLAGMQECEIALLRFGALLHDIGKIGIPVNILLKPCSLSGPEWEIVRKHPRYAYELLFPIEYFRRYIPIPYSHHEKWDGTGYPEGLKGEAIPLPARLFAVVDVWDALASERAFRKAWAQDQVMEYIQRQAGAQFDPWAVELFIRAMSTTARPRKNSRAQAISHGLS